MDGQSTQLTLSLYIALKFFWTASGLSFFNSKWNNKNLLHRKCCFEESKSHCQHFRPGRGDPDGLCEIASTSGGSSGPSSDVSSSFSSSSVLQDEKVLRIAKQIETLKASMAKPSEVKTTVVKPVVEAPKEPLVTAASLRRIPTPQTASRVAEIIGSLRASPSTTAMEGQQGEVRKDPIPQPKNEFVLPSHVSW